MFAVALALVLGSMPLQSWECLPDILRVQVLQEMAGRHKALEPDCLRGEISVVSKGEEAVFEGKCLKYQGKEA